MAFDVYLIDGRSGSGKTQYAARLSATLRAQGLDPQILSVEDLYPGWDGLAAGSRAVAPVLDRGRYRRFDWIRGRFAEERHIRRFPPLIIEGCGAITRANIAAAERWAGGNRGLVHSIWIEAGEAMRRKRALARDGRTYAPHWRLWAAQEVAHYRTHQPWRLADQRVRSDGRVH